MQKLSTFKPGTKVKFKCTTNLGYIDYCMDLDLIREAASNHYDLRVLDDLADVADEYCDIEITFEADGPVDERFDIKMTHNGDFKLEEQILCSDFLEYFIAFYFNEHHKKNVKFEYFEAELITKTEDFSELGDMVVWEDDVQIKLGFPLRKYADWQNNINEYKPSLIWLRNDFYQKGEFKVEYPKKHGKHMRKSIRFNNAKDAIECFQALVGFKEFGMNF